MPMEPEDPMITPLEGASSLLLVAFMEAGPALLLVAFMEAGPAEAGPEDDALLPDQELGPVPDLSESVRREPKLMGSPPPSTMAREGWNNYPQQTCRKI